MYMSNMFICARYRCIYIYAYYMKMCYYSYIKKICIASKPLLYRMDTWIYRYRQVCVQAHIHVQFWLGTIRMVLESLLKSEVCVMLAVEYLGSIWYCNVQFLYGLQRAHSGSGVLLICKKLSHFLAHWQPLVSCIVCLPQLGPRL